tara:strand:+ start:263 stop:430 length:168 start_codon:yes stop_codon:yes gene_type:complete
MGTKQAPYFKLKKIEILKKICLYFQRQTQPQQQTQQQKQTQQNPNKRCQIMISSS